MARSSSTSRLNSSMPSLVTRNFRRAVLRFFFSPSRAKTRRDRLRDRQDLFFGTEFVEQLGLMRDGAQAAADVEFEAALRLAVVSRVTAMAPRSCSRTSAAGIRRGSRRRRS